MDARADRGVGDLQERRVARRVQQPDVVEGAPHGRAGRRRERRVLLGSGRTDGMCCLLAYNPNVRPMMSRWISLVPP